MPKFRVSALLGLLCGLVLGSDSRADGPADKKTPFNVSELNERPIIGRLCMPLGTCGEIEATIIAGRDLREKQYDGVYLLSVTHVVGKKLASRVVLRFSTAPGVTVGLARDGFELHELKTGKKTGTLTDATVRELEKGYLGKTVKLTVYEVGAFSGLPCNLPDRKFWWADTGFHFSTSLVVVRERK